MEVLGHSLGSEKVARICRWYPDRPAPQGLDRAHESGRRSANKQSVASPSPRLNGLPLAAAGRTARRAFTGRGTARRWCWTCDPTARNAEAGGNSANGSLAHKADGGLAANGRTAQLQMPRDTSDCGTACKCDPSESVKSYRRPPQPQRNTHILPRQLGPNVRHERRAKGREAAFGTSARWRG